MLPIAFGVQHPRNSTVVCACRCSLMTNMLYARCRLAARPRDVLVLFATLNSTCLRFGPWPWCGPALPPCPALPTYAQPLRYSSRQKGLSGDHLPPPPTPRGRVAAAAGCAAHSRDTRLQAPQPAARSRRCTDSRVLNSSFLVGIVSTEVK